MSSYNYIEKIKYTKNPSDVVALQEYILFQDDNAGEKFVVFKFLNNLNQRLYSIKFEVLQYDMENNLVERSIAVYDKFQVEPNNVFVPNAKLQVNYACRSIIVNLVLAEFDRVKWENGEFSDNSYKFEKYAGGVSAQQPYANYGMPMGGKNAPAAPKAKGKHSSKVVFTVKNVSRKNAAVFPKIFNILACIAVVAFVVISVFLFNSNSKKIHIDGYDLERDGKTVSILSYDGKTSELEIPDKIGSYTVTKIKTGAFKGSSLKSVSFANTAELTIETNAFSNSKSLETVSGLLAKETINVMGESFANCAALKTVEMPTALLAENCFKGDALLKDLSFSDFASSMAIYRVFGLGEETKIELNNVKANITKMPLDFFTNVTVKTLDINYDKCEITYGALKEANLTGYGSSEYCEWVNGELRSLKIIDNTLVIPRAVNKVSYNKSEFVKKFKTVDYLKLETVEALDNNFFAQFTALKTIEITSAKAITSQSLTRLESLTTFIAPVLGSDVSLRNYIGNNANIEKVMVVGTLGVHNGYFDGCNVAEIDIAGTVPSVASDAFKNMEGLKTLAVPCYENLYLNEQFTGLGSLENIELRPTENNKAIGSNFFNDLNSLKSIVLAEGFTTCGTRFINGLPALERVVLPSTITTYTSTAIGSNCQNLKTVVVDFSSASALPDTYDSFNKSGAYTENLSIVLAEGMAPDNFFTAGCTGLKRLSLTCDGIAKSGILSACKKLQYLELHTGEIASSITLEKLFASTENSELRLTLSTVIIDTASLCEGFFASVEMITLQNVVLMNTTSMESNPLLGCEGINWLFLPDTLTYDATLFECLRSAAIRVVYAAGSEPEDSSLLSETQEYKWNSTAAQEQFFAF